MVVYLLNNFLRKPRVDVAYMTTTSVFMDEARHSSRYVAVAFGKITGKR